MVPYMILRNKIVQPKVGQSGILNMSFIYDKTSPSKGGMIGTVYHNFIIQYLSHFIVFSRSSPKDPCVIQLRHVHGHHGPMHAWPSITANSQ